MNDVEIINGKVKFDIYKPLAKKIKELTKNNIMELHDEFWLLITGEAKSEYDDCLSKNSHIENFDIEPIDLSNITFKLPLRNYIPGKNEAVKWLPPINFSKCVFEQEVILDGVEFGGLLQFNDTIFKKPVNFDNCIFKGVVDFSQCKFFKYDLSLIGDFSASFVNAHFEGEMKCIEADFQKDVIFNRAVFDKEVTFMSTKFSAEVEFDGAKFKDIVSYEGCIFGYIINFNNCNFDNTTRFNGVDFNNAPTFHNAKMHEDTSFYKASFSGFSEEDDLRAYRKLKQLMADAQSGEAESFFFSCEQRTRRNLNKVKFNCGCLLRQQKVVLGQDSIFNKIISYVYDIESDYGQSIVGPLFSWFTQLILAFIFYLTHANDLRCEQKWIENSPTIKSLFFSLQGSIYPLSNFNRDSLIFADGLSVTILSIFQNIYSLAMIALFIIAIRRNFYKGGD